MKSLKQSLGIDDTYTKLYRRPTKADEQTKVKDNVYLKYLVLLTLQLLYFVEVLQ